MNVPTIIQALCEGVEAGLSLDETVDTFINTASGNECMEILSELGDVDLSEPKPDLKAGWSKLQKQLAYNALYIAVYNRMWSRSCRNPCDKEIPL